MSKNIDLKLLSKNTVTPNIITFIPTESILLLYTIIRIVRVGEFTANTKYVRKRIDFNVFDDVGHGHKIHATAFNMMERQVSIDINEPYKEPDTVSNDGSSITNNSTLGRRRSSVTSTYVKRPNYLTLGKGMEKRATTAGMKFPAVPSAFPKAPGGTSFPVVPESPTSSSHSDVSDGRDAIRHTDNKITYTSQMSNVSEKSQNREMFRQV